MSDTKRIDAVLLAKAKYDYDKDREKLAKYNMLPLSHKMPKNEYIKDECFVEEVTPLMVADAATARAKEYGKDVKVYTKELEISVKRMSEHGPVDMLQGNYKRYESYDLAAEAAQAENPFAAILGQ